MDTKDFEKYILKIVVCTNSVIDDINDEYVDSAQKLIGKLAEVIGEIYMEGFKDGLTIGIKKQEIGIENV